MAEYSEFQNKLPIKSLTSAHSLQRIEERHQQVHEDGQVKGDAAPERHVARTPVQEGLS